MALPSIENDKLFMKLYKLGLFKVNKSGKITYLPTSFIFTKIGSSGYIPISVKHEGKKKAIQAHRFVWLVYKGKIPYGKVINHLDGLKDNNKLSNLECASYSRNNKHSYELNPSTREKISVLAIQTNKHKRKLTNKQVIFIRNSTLGYFILAKKFKVGKSTIRKIVKYTTYADV